MNKIAIVTDSNSGITQLEAEKIGIFVIPMPFYIDGKFYLEGVNLTQEAFYEKLTQEAEISTSCPSPGDVIDLWEKLLETYEQVIYIPMSSSLSSSCQTAIMMAQDYEGKVFVVDNQRISVSLKQSVLEAAKMAKEGMDASAICETLEKEKLEASIYITLESLKYLKKGGRITPAAAAVGTVLNIKPVLQIQGEKLDAYAKARGKKQAHKMMVKALQDDLENRFLNEAEAGKLSFYSAYTGDPGEAEEYIKELEEVFGVSFTLEPLPLSISCHIGPGAVGIGVVKNLV
ncbi:MAG: DegV family protein [Lachnospiraceae bacterium]|nr:DegV family protein [Lachnospiraceae bacterium]